MSTLTERVLQCAREVATGETASAMLTPMLAELAAAAETASRQFNDSAVGSPEIDSTTVHLVAEIFERWREDIAALERAAAEDDPIAVSIAADAMEYTVGRLRAAQQAYGRALETESGTPWPFVNRMLRHVAYFRAGGTELHHARHLITESAAFNAGLEEHVACLAEGDERMAGESAAADLRAAIERFADAVGGDGPTVHSDRGGFDIVEQALQDAAARLVQALGEHVERELSYGPTPFPAVNLVLTAADRRLRGEVSDAALSDVVARCKAMVAAGDSADAEALEARQNLLNSLDALLEQARDPEPFAMHFATGSIARTANVLASTLSPSSAPVWDEDDSMFDFVSGTGLQADTGGMPLMLASLQGLAESYLAGVATAEQVLAGVSRLEAVLDRFASRPPADGEAAFLAAMPPLHEAVECLRTVVSTRDRRVLDTAVACMREASEGLGTV